MKNIKYILLMTIVFILSACGAETDKTKDGLNEELVNITILGTSDIHGFLMPWDYEIDEEIATGSLSQISTAVKEYRKENENVVLVDAGDLIQGNKIEMFTNEDEHPGIKAFNYLEYDAITLGNHEFDFGVETMENILSQFDNSIIASNVVMKDDSELLNDYKIIEKDGINIALIGMTTPLSMVFHEDRNIAEYLDIVDPVEETKKIVEELKDEADVIIGVAHMGVENENGISNTGVEDLANQVPELDAIVAGHMHEDISEEIINGVIITEPSVYAEKLSVIDIQINKNTGDKDIKSKTIDVSDFERDSDFEKIIAKEHQLARDDANEVLGKIDGAPMTHDDELPNVPYDFLHSTPINRFFNDVQLHYSNADVVATLTEMNHKLDGDTIQKKDINYNYNFILGETSVFEMTGEELKTYMEWSADYFNTLKPGDITVSFNPERRTSKYSTYDTFGGLNYIIDLTEEYGNRIKDIVYEETGEPVKDDDVIKVGMNQYRLDQLLSEGEIFEGKSFEPIWASTDEFGEDGTIRNMAMNYITDVKDGVITTVDNPYWEIRGYDEDSDEYKAVKYLANEGAIELKSLEDGKVTNIESENEFDELTASEAQEIEEKLNIEKTYKEGMSKGDFYVAAYKKAAESDN